MIERLSTAHGGCWKEEGRISSLLGGSLPSSERSQSVSHIWATHGDNSPGSELPYLVQLLEFSLFLSLPGCPHALSSEDLMAMCTGLKSTPPGKAPAPDISLRSDLYGSSDQSWHHKEITPQIIIMKEWMAMC